MSSLVSCFLTLKLHLNDCDFDSRPLFLVSLFASLYIHIHIHILLLLLYTIFPGPGPGGCCCGSHRVTCHPYRVIVAAQRTPLAQR